MIIYIDMDDVLCHFSLAKTQAIKENPGIQFPQSQYGFYESLMPIDGAIESVELFIASPNIEPYILTAPSLRNPLSYTEKRVWVEKTFGFDFVERLIICSNKSLLKGNILIDDNASGHGQENFNGTFIHFGSSQYPNWESVRNAIDF